MELTDNFKAVFKLDDSFIERENNLKYSNIIEEILKRKILMRLKNGMSMLMDGRVIKFSDVLKKQSACPNFDYKLSFEDVERKDLTKLCEFFAIIEYNKAAFIEEIKAEELKNWYTKYKALMPNLLELCKYLNIQNIPAYVNRVQGENTTKNLKPLNPIHNRSHSTMSDARSQSMFVTGIDQVIKTKNFGEAVTPVYDSAKLSLSLPVSDLNLTNIKLNACKSLADDRGRMYSLLKKNREIEELVDAMIGDSFWFIVLFFQYNTKLHLDEEDKPKEWLVEAKKQNEEILKRISHNFFQFFIKLCEENVNKDPIQKNFYDFIAQSVFYSIYLAFPKSRHIFTSEFKNCIVCVFAYLYNGLTLTKYTVSHWDLDLGTGNIIEDDDFYKKLKDEDEGRVEIYFPKIPDIMKFDIFHVRETRHKKGKSVSSASTLKLESIQNKKEKDIINTPLYRLYAENKSFETLNMIKPILVKKRKFVYSEKNDEKIANAVKFGKDTVAKMKKIRQDYEEYMAESNKLLAKRTNEILGNIQRIKKEFSDIKASRCQEYANYCMFISSK